MKNRTFLLTSLTEEYEKVILILLRKIKAKQNHPTHFSGF